MEANSRGRKEKGRVEFEMGKCRKRKKSEGEDYGKEEEGEGGEEGSETERGRRMIWKIWKQTQQWKQDKTETNKEIGEWV